MPTPPYRLRLDEACVCPEHEGFRITMRARIFDAAGLPSIVILSDPRFKPLKNPDLEPPPGPVAIQMIASLLSDRFGFAVREARWLFQDGVASTNGFASGVEFMELHNQDLAYGRDMSRQELEELIGPSDGYGNPNGSPVGEVPDKGSKLGHPERRTFDDKDLRQLALSYSPIMRRVYLDVTRQGEIEDPIILLKTPNPKSDDFVSAMWQVRYEAAGLPPATIQVTPRAKLIRDLAAIDARLSGEVTRLTAIVPPAPSFFVLVISAPIAVVQGYFVEGTTASGPDFEAKLLKPPPGESPPHDLRSSPSDA